MIKVFIVDDHPIVHDGVAAILRGEPDLALAGSAAGVAQALAAIPAAAPDVVLLDLQLPGGSGVDQIGRLLAARPGVRIVMFTAHDAEEYVLAATRAGATGYVLKGSPAQELVQAIRQVHAGESFLSPSIGAALARQAAHPGRGGTLTARELAVLRLVAAGHSNQDVAATLGITERTVKFHVTAIFNKLGADNRAQAVALAGRRGLLG
jgi:DNA-binding NarL/FixJ family response regulator